MIGIFFLELKGKNNLNDLIKNFDDISNIEKLSIKNRDTHLKLSYYRNGEWKGFYYFSPEKTVPYGTYAEYPNKLFNKNALIAMISLNDGCDITSIILRNTFNPLSNEEAVAKGFEIKSDRLYFTLEFAKILKLIGNATYHYYRNVKNRICTRESIDEYIINNNQSNEFDYYNRLNGFDTHNDYNFNDYSEVLFNHAFVPINSYEFIYSFGPLVWNSLWYQYLCTDGKTEFIVTDVQTD